MANLNAPFGLRPTGRNKNGGPVELNPYTKAASEGNAIYQWDAVTVDVNNRISANITPGTSYYAGVALNYAAASVLSQHMLMDQDDALFEIQADGTLNEASGIGMNANISTSTAGSSATKISGQALSASSLATTNTLDLKVVQKGREAVPNANNTVAGVVYGTYIGNDFGSYAKVLVVFNKHRYASGGQVLGI
jgi:hypothetical protein